MDQDAALDVTVINPLWEATVVGAVAAEGDALTVAHRQSFGATVDLVDDLLKKDGNYYFLIN